MCKANIVKDTAIVWADCVNRSCLKFRKRKQRPRGFTSKRSTLAPAKIADSSVACHARWRWQQKGSNTAILIEWAPHDMMLRLQTTSYILDGHCKSGIFFVLDTQHTSRR